MGNVAQAEDLAVGVDGNSSDVLDAVRAACDAQVGVGGVGLNHTTGVHGRLCLDGAGDAARIQSQLRQLIGLHLHEDFFRLHANKLHLFDVLDAVKIQLDFFGVFAHILVGEAVACQGVDVAVNIVKAVIVIGTECAAGEVLFAIVHDVAQLQPALTHGVASDLVLEGNGDDTHARTRIAGDFINLRQGLDLLFQLVGEVHFDLLGAGAGPGGRNNHLLYSKAGVLAAAEGFEGKDAHDEHQKGKKVNQLAVGNGPACPVDAVLVFVWHHWSPPSNRRTCCLSTSLARPAVISTSPLWMPLLMTALLPL